MNSIRIAFALALVGLLASAKAEDHNDLALSSNLKTECVGRYQITLPSKVETALISDIRMDDHTVSPRFQFSDGSTASFSTGPEVSRLVSENEFNIFHSSYLDVRNEFIKQLIRQGNKKAQSITVLDITDTKPASFGLEANDYAEKFIYANQHLFYFYGSDDNSNFIKTGLLSTFQSRALYKIPNQPGVCFPYGFFADDGKKTRNIGVTMRLIDHPDVEIFFKDSSYPLTAMDTLTPKQIIETFWEFGNRQVIKQAKMDWHGYRSIKMDNRDGTGLFVTLTRYDHSTYHGNESESLGVPADGGTDYGYVAVVKGDPKAKEDTPSLMMYVIRTAARARAKGIEPVSKDDIKAIAESVMASIKRHPITPE